ncbi:MAG: VCBS repeat-containing protein, partial [Candidatus Latescibacterota bacterium]
MSGRPPCPAWLVLCLLLAPFAPLLSADAALRFSNRASSAGVADPGEANGAAFGDYDGDGWPDLLVTRLGPGEEVLLYRNEGDGTFSGGGGVLESDEQTIGGLFVDVDRDGDLDVYLIHYQGPNQVHRNEG